MPFLQKEKNSINPLNFWASNWLNRKGGWLWLSAEGWKRWLVTRNTGFVRWLINAC